MVNRLTVEEKEIAKSLHSNLLYFRAKNRTPLGFYDGSRIPEIYGISVPPKMRSLKAVLGWGSIVVDTLEERLDFFGYNSPIDFGLDEMFTENALEVESSLAHHDSLLYGTGFAVVGTGFAGEPSPLITIESPNDITAVYDRRRRRVSCAYSLDSENNTAQLYLPFETIYVDVKGSGNDFVVIDRDKHNLGRVPVVRFDNRMTTRGHGQSEISEAVEYLCDAAARTAIRMEISSEFYSAPKEVILGGDKELLLDANGNPTSAWTSYMGRVQQIPWDDDEESKTNPQMIQLDPSDPAPFINQIDMFASQLAANAGFPLSYLGISTNIPVTADAIKAGEIKLVKRAERRQKIFGQSWLEVARLGMLVRDGEIPEEFHQVSTNWMDASTPTRAATVDATVKLVQSGIIPADSAVVSDELNLTPSQRATLERERMEARGQATIAALIGGREVPDVLSTDTEEEAQR